MIRIDKLNKYYNRHRKNEIHVINDTSLELPDTGLVALLGPSGCGKTTLLNAIGGLDKVNNGNIFIDDKKITRKWAFKVDKIRNLNIGYIFQDYKLIDNMSVYDNVAMVLKMIGIKDKAEIKKRVEYILERVGMYRYKYRPCEMLSGGERQRVGIARALVKNPDIILADEPTGNLDSKNTIEIMNIIKSISKDKLVILVTHEVDLAKFYATRIIELSDGSVLRDYKNKNVSEIDYRMDNTFYLKDFKYHNTNHDNDINIEYYSDKVDKLNLIIVFKNGNIYIKNKDNNKIEVVDSNSSVEFVNDNYRKLDKSVYEKYSFDFEKIINKDIKLRYSSIFNIFSIITYGFRKIFSYSLMKKILLVGFLLSSMFVTYSISNMLGLSTVSDKEFIKTNKNYLRMTSSKNNVDEYLEYEKIEDINYMIPGNGMVNFTIKGIDYYQTNGVNINLSGSLSSDEMISDKDIILGRMPNNSKEIVIDKMVYDRTSGLKMMGLYEIERLIDKKVFVGNALEYTIVGIVNLDGPSIYVDKEEFIDILSNTQEKTDGRYRTQEILDNDMLYNYELYKNKIKITKGREPNNDYEVIVNSRLSDSFKLDKYIDSIKVNGNKLKVVGYYTSENDINSYFVSKNTIKYGLIEKSSNITIYAKDKDKVINKFKDIGKNVEDVYTYDKNIYLEQIKDSVKSSMIVAGIMLAISLIEIILMVRSSFLSRIKEVGIFRAIGVKKSDIYKMFIGESFAITTITSIPGILFMSYCLYVVKDISYVSNNYLINGYVVILCIILMYLFNIIIGLIPVFNTIRKSPAEILSRHDLD